MEKIREYTFSEWLRERAEKYGDKPALKIGRAHV